jgi:integrase
MGVTSRGGVWYVKWRRADGKWVRKATTATKKTEAQALHAELVRQSERQRAGLDPMPPELGYTLWKLCEWWLANHVSARSQRRQRSLLELHVKAQPHGQLGLRQVGAGVLDEYFNKLERDGYAPRTINLLRAYLISTVERAKKANLWAGDNPARNTKRREVMNIPRPTLTAEEVDIVIRNVHQSWRGWFATACWLGLRKGELAGLRKSDFDKVRRTLTVQRSYANEGTKGKRVDVLPVSDALAPYLVDALASPGQWMFPNPDGKMRTENCGPEDILRHALKRAGLIEGWRYSCRRCLHRSKKPGSTVKPHQEFHTEEDTHRCPQCSMLLYPHAVVREIKAHDMRHTCATLLLKAGVPVQHVQRIIRHASIKITVDTYGHLLTEDLRAGVEKLGPQPVHTTKKHQTA